MSRYQIASLVLLPDVIRVKPVTTGNKQGGVSNCGLAIYIKKYLKAKEELSKFKYFTMQKYNRQGNPLRETKILQDIITL
jgi:hypothetical protein